MLWFVSFSFFVFISGSEERRIPKDDLDATKCNYGKHYEENLNWCNCSNVLGNETHCEIKKLFNSTHIQFIFATFPDHLESWKKNLEIQFPKDNVTILEETKYGAYGFVNNNLYFHIQFHPNKSDKKDFLMPRWKVEMIVKILSKKRNITAVPVKEKIWENIDTSKRNEKKLDKDLDATNCNYGKHYEKYHYLCNCSNVLGNETHCEIKKLFNSTHIQIILATFPDHLDSWKKNLETQFPKDNVTILEETKYNVYGIVNNDLYFDIHFRPNKSDKNVFLIPRWTVEMMEKFISKKLNITSVPAKEKIRENIDTSKRNEKKLIKKRNITAVPAKKEIWKKSETFKSNEKKEHFNAGESIYNFGSVIKLMMGIISAFVIQHYL